MNWILIGLKVIGEVILPWYMSKRHRKKAARIEKVAEAVIKGVEEYTADKEAGNKPDIKSTIRSIAHLTGVEDKLHEMVKRWTTPKPK